MCEDTGGCGVSGEVGVSVDGVSGDVGVFEVIGVSGDVGEVGVSGDVGVFDVVGVFGDVGVLVVAGVPLVGVGVAVGHVNPEPNTQQRDQLHTIVVRI